MATPGKETRPALAFAASALVMGLARPEGVFLGGFFLLGVVAYRGGDGARRIAGAFALVFLTLGLAYFLWRWHYFGHPLPNPFYKKGAGVLHAHSLRQAWRDTARLGPPFLVVLAAGLVLRSTRRFAAFALFPVLAFACLWVLIADETNYVMRFRHPILPILLVAWVPVWQELARRLPLSRWSAVPGWAGWAVAIAVAAGLSGFQHLRFRSVAQHRMGLFEAALVLRDYARWNYSLVTTEAGLLPLYSTWRAVDAWGLNDSFIAHHGQITPEYLDRYRPEVIVFHAFFSPRTPQEGERIESRSLGKPWYRMVRTLKEYAERNDYELAAVFGRDPYDTHWYYVRRGFPRSEEIAARIRALDYYWDGAPTTDFAQPGS